MKYCNDCMYYLPVDVFKGMCKVTKEKITPGDKSCKEYKEVAKCKFCKNYRATDEFIGLCMGKTEAYPDLLAKTCEDFMKN